jgi:hypothetical protein
MLTKETRIMEYSDSSEEKLRQLERKIDVVWGRSKSNLSCFKS